MKKSIAIALLCLISSMAFSQNSMVVEFYGTKSNVDDKAKITQIQDLFFLYLSDFDGVSILDRRNEFFFGEENNSDNFVFFAELQQAAQAWICTFRIFKPNSSVQISSTKTYANYSKFLLGIRTSLNALFASIQGSDTVAVAEKVTSSSELAGNWVGETDLEKIVILRGGERGIVFFKGGGSMSVSVTMEDNKIIVKQSVRSNAMFYPSLPREIALAVGLTADPMVWTFGEVGFMKMRGLKNTMGTVYQDGIPVNAEPITQEIEWTKVD